MNRDKTLEHRFEKRFEMIVEVSYENQCGDNKTVTYEYDHTTTVKNLIDTFHIRYEGRDGITILDGRTMKSYENSYYIDYVIVNDKVLFTVPIEKCKLLDYISSYNLERISIKERYFNLGCVEWFSSEFINKVIEYIFGELVSYGGKKYIEKHKVKEKIQKFFNFHNKDKNIDVGPSINAYLHDKKCWDLDEICDKLSMDKTVASIFLNSYGYLSTVDNKYFFSNDYYDDLIQKISCEKLEN